jgi:hypothetical protein
VSLYVAILARVCVCSTCYICMFILGGELVSFPKEERCMYVCMYVCTPVCMVCEHYKIVLQLPLGGLGVFPRKYRYYV